MKIFKLLFTFALLSISLNTFAQHELSEEDKVELQNRVKLKVEEFQGYLSDIVNTKLSDNQRKNQITAALALFIGKGQDYTVVNEYGERENRKAVRMQLSSLNGSTRWLAMTKYLNNQSSNVHKYRKVVIQSADAVRVDNIHKTADGKYEAVAYFCQKYVAFRASRIVYSDVTSKKVKVYVDAIEIPGGGVVWDAKLGDVYVTSTNPLGK